MQLSEFVELFRHLNPDAFLARFPDPFLLETKDSSREPAGERRVFPLRVVGPAIRIGRGTRCHVPIPETLVSTTHAELLPPDEPDRPWRVQDLGSTNQTFVDGRPLPDCGTETITDGSRVGFGPDSSYLFLSATRFLQQFHQELAPAGRSDDATTVSDDVVGGARLLPGQLRTRPRASEALDDGLLLLCPPMDPFPLLVGQTLVIGRQARSCDVILPSDQVSRRHLELERRESGVFVRDLGSSNGTIVGEVELGDEWYPVPLSIPIAVGGYRLTVERLQSRAQHVDTRRVPKDRRPAAPSIET